MKKTISGFIVMLLILTLIFTSCNTSGSNETETEKVWKPGDYEEFYSGEEKTSAVNEPISENSDFEDKKDSVIQALKNGYEGRTLKLKNNASDEKSTTFDAYDSKDRLMTQVVVVHEKSDNGKNYDMGVYSFVENFNVLDTFENDPWLFEATFVVNAFAAAFYINEVTDKTTSPETMYEMFSRLSGGDNIQAYKSNDGQQSYACLYFTVCGVECLYVNYFTGLVVACDAGIDAIVEKLGLTENNKVNSSDVSSEANSDKQVSTEEVGSFAESVEPTTKREEPTTKKEPTTVWEPSTEAMHIHSYVNHEGKKATCTESGYSSYKTCSCGYTDYSEIPAMGHDYALVEIKNPTCEEEGYEKYSCVNCNDSYKNSERALGHDFSEATCVAPKTCANCGKTEGIVSDHVMSYAECKYCDYKDYSCFAFSSNEFCYLSWYRVLPDNTAVNLEDGEASITIDKNGNGKIKFADYSFTFKLGKQRVESYFPGQSVAIFSVIVNGNEIGGYDDEGITFVGDDRCMVNFHEAECDALGPEFSDISQIKFDFYMN